MRGSLSERQRRLIKGGESERVARVQRLAAGTCACPGWLGGCGPRSVCSGAAGLCVIVRNRLGPRQQREVLRLFVEGRPVGRYELGPQQAAMNLPIQFSRPGRYGYRLVGHVDYPEGRAQLNSTGVFDVRPGAVFDVMIDELRDTVFLDHDPYSRAVSR